MTPFQRVALLAVVLVSCIGCDQVTKGIAAHTLAHGPERSFLGHSVRLVYAENPGGFLGLGETLPAPLRAALFVSFTSLAVLGLGAFALTSPSLRPLQRVAAACIAAGGASNLIDRVTRGSARDFIIVGVGPLHTGIFNLADLAITSGALLLLVLAARAQPLAPDRTQRS